MGGGGGGCRDDCRDRSTSSTLSILCHELKMYFLPVKIVSQYQPDMKNLSYTVTKTDFLISGGLVLTQQVCFVFTIFLASKMFHV